MNEGTILHELEFLAELSDILSERNTCELCAKVRVKKGDGNEVEEPLLLYATRKRYERVRYNPHIGKYNAETSLEIISAIVELYEYLKDAENIDVVHTALQEFGVKKYLCPRVFE